MNPFTERTREIVARYLDGRQSLESAATEFAQAWKDWIGARDAGRPLSVDALLADGPDNDVLQRGDIFGLVSLQAEFPRLLELMELVDRKMSTRDKGAA